jgi:hypothetical protein
VLGHHLGLVLSQALHHLQHTPPLFSRIPQATQLRNASASNAAPCTEWLGCCTFVRMGKSEGQRSCESQL